MYIILQDHQYALDPDKVKHKLTEAKERLEELQRDLRNAKDRERRHKKIVETLLDNLKCRNMLTKELQQKLDFHSGWLCRTDSSFKDVWNIIEMLETSFKIIFQYIL